MTNADLVADFHRAVGVDLPSRPSVPSLAALDLREALVREEFDEVMEQFGRVRALVAAGEDVPVEDLAAFAHELTDLVYVAYGALVTLGIPANAVFAEVHRANMAKTSGPRRADGKQLKPEGWRPADVLGVLSSPSDVGPPRR
jgi:predicted HAD superfamily Cof-like phosphohydrolase